MGVVKYTIPFDVKEYNTDDLLNECYDLIYEARCKLPKNSEYPICIVLPINHLRALRYALARDTTKQMAVIGSLNPYENRLFGAILRESPITEKVFVY